MSFSQNIYPERDERYDVTLQQQKWLPCTVEISRTNHLLKQSVWLFFFLLLFEGALRKWFLPSLATPLLVVRDPLAVWLIAVAWKRNLLPSNVYLIGMAVFGFTGLITAVFLGHGNLPVAVYGARILLIHFPVMFIIGRVFTAHDVVKIGKAMLWISIPMIVITALQFYSPQSAWVNRGVGGDMEGSGFNGGAMGYFRPSGTFSFTTGNTLFFSLLAPFVFYFWLQPKGTSRLLLIAATLSLFASIPISISRGLLFQVGVTLIFTILATAKNPRYIRHILTAVIAGFLVFAILSNTEFFRTATEVFFARFESASDDEGGLKGTLVDRFLGGLLSAVSESDNQPFWGYGIGMGTNVGSMLLTGDREFLIAEGEWGRLIGEMGPLMGLGVIIIRLGFCSETAILSYRKVLAGDMLPWILLSAGVLIILQGQWAQPTTLGFSTFMGGLILASLQEPYKLRLRIDNNASPASA